MEAFSHHSVCTNHCSGVQHNGIVGSQASACQSIPPHHASLLTFPPCAALQFHLPVNHRLTRAKGYLAFDIFKRSNISVVECETHAITGGFLRHSATQSFDHENNVFEFRNFCSRVRRLSAQSLIAFLLTPTVIWYIHSRKTDRNFTDGMF